MKNLDLSKLTENFIEDIGKEWMLITAGTKDSFNTMTASWGGVGFLWNKPIAFCVVRPERYTFNFVEKSDYFTLSFLGEENKDIHKVCGTKSGRDTNKIEETGLVPVETSFGNIAFNQARLTLECKKLYADLIKEDHFFDKSLFNLWYNEKQGNPHKLYIAEIVAVWGKDLVDE